MKTISAQTKLAKRLLASIAEQGQKLTNKCDAQTERSHIMAQKTAEVAGQTTVKHNNKQEQKTKQMLWHGKQGTKRLSTC